MGLFNDDNTHHIIKSNDQHKKMQITQQAKVQHRISFSSLFLEQKNSETNQLSSLLAPTVKQFGRAQPMFPA